MASSVDPDGLHNGGFAATELFDGSVNGLQVESVLIAIAGAVVVLVAWRLLAPRHTSRLRFRLPRTWRLQASAGPGRAAIDLPTPVARATRGRGDNEDHQP